MPAQRSRVSPSCVAGRGPHFPIPGSSHVQSITDLSNGSESPPGPSLHRDNTALFFFFFSPKGLWDFIPDPHFLRDSDSHICLRLGLHLTRRCHISKKNPPCLRTATADRCAPAEVPGWPAPGRARQHGSRRGHPGAPAAPAGPRHRAHGAQLGRKCGRRHSGGTGRGAARSRSPGSPRRGFATLRAPGTEGGDAAPAAPASRAPWPRAAFSLRLDHARRPRQRMRRPGTLHRWAAAGCFSQTHKDGFAQPCAHCLEFAASPLRPTCHPYHFRLPVRSGQPPPVDTDTLGPCRNYLQSKNGLCDAPCGFPGTPFVLCISPSLSESRSEPRTCIRDSPEALKSQGPLMRTACPAPARLDCESACSCPYENGPVGSAG